LQIGRIGELGTKTTGLTSSDLSDLSDLSDSSDSSDQRLNAQRLNASTPQRPILQSSNPHPLAICSFLQPLDFAVTCAQYPAS
jgi:hypothetical protein